MFEFPKFFFSQKCPNCNAVRYCNDLCADTDRKLHEGAECKLMSKKECEDEFCRENARLLIRLVKKLPEDYFADGWI